MLKKNNNYKVYVHICPNGKKYVGITQQKVEQRWKKGEGYKTQSYFYKAILKYGWDNIQHNILYEQISYEKACEKEIELIKKYKTTNKNFGYNISTGGDGNNNAYISEKQKDILRKALKGNKNAKGYIHTIEEREKMRKAKLGKPNVKLSKKVLCVETNKIYPSIAEAKRQTGISHIDQVCRGERNYAGKHKNNKLHWKYI